MTQKEQIAALQAEVAALRETVEQLQASAVLGSVHHHHHYAPVPPITPQPWIQPSPLPFQPAPSLPYITYCGGAVDSASAGYSVSQL